MPEPSVRKPALVIAAPGGQPQLRARRCACGHLFFPPQAYGCERCGRSAEALAEELLEARGVLTAVTTVHAHPKRAVPYGLGRVALDAGPSIDVCLVAGAAPALGVRVSGRLVPEVEASGAVLLDCLFDEERAS